MVYCNNEECKYNEKQQCTNAKLYYVNRLCVTYRRQSRRDDYSAMMQTSRPNCHKSGGKYKVDHSKTIKQTPRGLQVLPREKVLTGLRAPKVVCIKFKKTG